MCHSLVCPKPFLSSPTGGLYNAITTENDVRFELQIQPYTDTLCFSISFSLCLCLSLSHTHTHTHTHISVRTPTTQTARSLRGIFHNTDSLLCIHSSREQNVCSPHT